LHQTGVAKRPRQVSFVDSAADGIGRVRKSMTTQIAKAQNATTASLGRQAINEISETLKQLLADVFTVYLKTKGFHWHITGRHFRDYHLLLDEQAEQIFVMTDDIAERARKLGGYTLRSIGDISRHQRIKDAENGSLLPRQMLSELRDDNVQLTGFLRSAHEVCVRHNDVATASLIEGWIDQTERRNWFLTELVSDS
jgi:starvation-inducible DNA-binding protein